MSNPGELFDACTAASLEGPRWRRSRPVLWLDGPYIQVGTRTWKPRGAKPSQDGSGTVFGYDARQCQQVSRALLPVLAELAADAERYASGAAGIGPADAVLPGEPGRPES